MDKSTFEAIYDKYSPMLYGIALQIFPSKIKAEELLFHTFKKILDQDIIQKQCTPYSTILLQLIIKTACEIYPEKLKNGIKLRQFENAPLINQFICEQIKLQDHCEKDNLTRQDVLQIIRKECNGIESKIDIAAKGKGW